jgi:hypothetical protein
MPEDRVSRGDAEAVLQEAAGVGRLLRTRANVKFGTPGDLNRRATIRPFSGTVFDGRHYCAEDWHVIVVAIFSDDSGRNDSYTKQDADADLNPMVITFSLDGKVLATERTQVKRVPTTISFPPDFIQEGRVMAPDELNVGTHTLSYTAAGPYFNDADSITFVIDPPGTGACA